MVAVTLVQSLQQETTCGICLTFFSKPVTLNCGHSFCQFCLTKSREAEAMHFSCPECREVSQNFPRLNVRLSKLAAICKKLNPQNLQNPVGQSLCQKHQQIPKLFCEEHQTSLCVVCSEAQEHVAHTLSPVEEAAQNLREKLQCTISHLRKKIKEMNELSSKKKGKGLIKWRKLIRGEYVKIHRYLYEEEMNFLDIVKHDDWMTCQLRDKYYNMINQHVKNMEDTIREMNETRCRPDLDLLEEGKELLLMSKLLLSDKPKTFTPELRQYSVTGMKDMLKKLRVNITMDPTTASPHVTISADLKSVRHEDHDEPNQSNRTERSYHFVLGHQTFSSDVHYWEVDVRKQPQWALGISTKCLRKRNKTQYSIGYLYMLRCEKRGDEFYLVTRPGLVCQQTKFPVPKIGIYLDYTERTLLFYNAIDASLIYGMRTMPLKEPVRPFFSPCPPMPGIEVGPMTICPVEGPSENDWLYL